MTTVLWPNVLDAPDLEGADVVVYDAAAPLPQEHLDAEVFVVWGRGEGLLTEDARSLTNLRLVQGLMAGPDALVAAGFPDGVPIASGVGLHDRTVAEHTLAMVLALVRRLPACLEAQSRHEWLTEISGPQPLHHAGPVTTLLEANVLIWGFGSIAGTLAPMLTGLGAHVRGVARSAGRRHGYDVITQDDLAGALAETDVLISILPGGSDTAGVIDAEVFAGLPSHAYVVNVGRGSVMNESDLVEALTGDRLGGAALDVMQSEPLPADSPLWTAPGILLTPHCAGGRPVEPEKLVAANLQALREGTPLHNAM